MIPGDVKSCSHRSLLGVDRQPVLSPLLRCAFAVSHAVRQLFELKRTDLYSWFKDIILYLHLCVRDTGQSVLLSDVQ